MPYNKINSKLINFKSVNISYLKFNDTDFLIILECDRWDDYLIPSPKVTKNEENQYI